MKRAEPADILKVLIAFSLLAVIGIGELRAQSCTATAYENGASFAGQSFVNVEVLPSFGGMQATVEAAVSEAISLWNAGCTGSHAWPLFVSGSSFTSKIAIISKVGRADQATGTCPNGAASYPPAAIAGFTYQGVTYPRGVVVFAESGCEGSLIQTLDPSSPYQQGDNLTNLFAHEIGHHVGLVVRQPSFDASWRSFTPLAALLLLDVGPATPASERLASDAKSSPDRLSIEG